MTLFSGNMEMFPLHAISDSSPLADFLQLCAGITAWKYISGARFPLRTVPSAGALYPGELYLQSRDSDEFVDGLYHYDPIGNTVQSLAAVDSGGVEGLTGDRRRLRGLMIVVSGVYGRSSWKYGDRAFRYCLLDAGHVCGAVEAACQLQRRPWRVRHRWEGETLQRALGCDMRELPLAVLECGVHDEVEVGNLDGLRLPWRNMGTWSVLPASSRPGTAASLCTHVVLRSSRLSGNSPPRSCAKPSCDDALSEPLPPPPPGGLMSQADLGIILRLVQQPVASDCDEEVCCFAVVHGVEGLPSGLYRHGELLRAGNLRRHAAHLCLEQALGGEGAVTFFLTGRAGNYRPLMLKAGLIGHRIYLAATALGLGCSGIGAFYDDEVRGFLSCDDMILYALAVGH